MRCDNKRCSNWELNKKGEGVCVYDGDTLTILSDKVCSKSEMLGKDTKDEHIH